MQTAIGLVPFHLAYTGFNNVEHLRTLHDVMVKADPSLAFFAPHLAPHVKGEAFTC